NYIFYVNDDLPHSDSSAADNDRLRDAAVSQPPKWGDRRSAPHDYIFNRPALLGKMRMGPDLANIGKAAPAEEEAAPPQPSPANPANLPATGASPAAANASPPPANARAQPKAAPPAQPPPPPAPGRSPPP